MAYNIFEHYDLEELLGKNYKFRDLGLQYGGWKFSRGAYSHRDYTKDGHLVIQETQEYEYRVDQDGLQRHITLVKPFVTWFDGEGNIGHREPLREISEGDSLDTVNENVRIIQMRFLKRRARRLELIAEGIPTQVRDIQPYKKDYDFLISLSQDLNKILRFYDADIIRYEKNGDPMLEERLRNETDPEIKPLLDFVPPPFPGTPPNPSFPSGETILQSILFQMTGETEI